MVQEGLWLRSRFVHNHHRGFMLEGGGLCFKYQSYTAQEYCTLSLSTWRIKGKK